MDDFNIIIVQQATDALQRLGVQQAETAAEVAESVLRQAVYWEKPLPDNAKLLFVRLFSPVVQREEVFLGNILFNAFLGKTFARAVAASGLGQAKPVANDLESYYFLVRTQADAPALAAAFHAEVERSLPDLFFCEPDEARGIYGNLSGMFTFRKSDFEPFPVYAVPQFLAPHLEKAVRRELDRLLSPGEFPKRVRTVLATLAFFYGRTSGGSGDAQSFSNFIAHLANEPDYDGLLETTEVKRAFNIATVDKDSIKQSVDAETYDPECLRQLLLALARAFRSSIDGGASKWLMGFLHKDEKFVNLPAVDYLNTLLGEAQLGYYRFARPVSTETISCRLCNTTHVAVQERYVTTGLNSFKFHNQSLRKRSVKVCVRCAFYAYLAQKLLGTQMVSAGGKLPQVPKTYNLVFHYGRHTNDEVAQLVKQFDLIWGLVQKHRAQDNIRSEAAKHLRELKEKAERERNAQKKQALETEIVQQMAKVQQAEVDLSAIEGEFDPWLAERPDLSRRPAENPSLDVLANLQLAETQTERHILGLGMGGYRMILFVLPQIRPPYDAKEHDFAQRRFSNSRVTVLTFLAFLRQLCGCDGPFYYQSLPTLTPDAFNPNTFYVRDEPIRVAEVQTRYEVVTQLAWRLIGERGPGGFVKKVVLAEKLLEYPLGTFAAVMRNSPVLGVRLDFKKKQYRRLPGAATWREDWGKTQDLTEYAQFIQQLSKL